MKKAIGVVILILLVGLLGWGRVKAAEDTSATGLTDEISEVHNLGDRMSTRMQAAIDRMRRLQQRVRSRIAKLKKNQKDVSQINILADSIDLSLDSAQTSLSHFREVLASTRTVADGYLAYEQLAAPIKTVKDDLLATQQTMKQMVWAMITLEKGVK